MGEIPPEGDAVESSEDGMDGQFSDEDETRNDSEPVASCPPLPVYKTGGRGKLGNQEKVIVPQVTPCSPQPPVYSKQALQMPGKDEKQV